MDRPAKAPEVSLNDLENSVKKSTATETIAIVAINWGIATVVAAGAGG